jgi:hypothetical protein
MFPLGSSTLLLRCTDSISLAGPRALRCNFFMCCLAAATVKASLRKDKKTVVRHLKLPVDYGALCSIIEGAFAECAVEDFVVNLSAASFADEQRLDEGWCLTVAPADGNAINLHVSTTCWLLHIQSR